MQSISFTGEKYKDVFHQSKQIHYIFQLTEQLQLMAVGLSAPEKLHPVPGFRLAACHSGIKADPELDDLVLLGVNQQASVAAVFTTNKFCAAPVTVARGHLQRKQSVRYLLINSGNANAGTGESGLQDATNCCQFVADYTQVNKENVLPFSTGVIGQPLAIDKIQAAIPELNGRLVEDNWLAAAKGIMTTDTLPKAISQQLTIDGQIVTITGMCKGSGMIRPDMATLLAFVVTDAQIDNNELSVLLKQAVENSFNAITVDGDTSTNDACVLIATGESSIKVDQHNQIFKTALNDVFKTLAQSIIRDGEGATKFVEIKVENAQTEQDAQELAYTIAHSPLVKTALFASDANWGRILAAIGRARVSRLEINKVNLYLGDVCLIEKGLPHSDYSEQIGQAEMNKQDIIIKVDLHLGEASVTVWTTDLSYDYVKINAEYRS